MLLSALVALYAAGLGSAQSLSSTSSAPTATHTVSVGAAGLVYSPNQLQANVSDVIEFRFYPQNHSVARSEYKSPCIPYEDTGVNKQGFWSGFRPVSVVLSNPPIFQIVINDTNPIFFYCSAPGACTVDGMIGVINPNSTETFETQHAYALNSTLMFSPGEYFPSEGGPSTTASTSPASSTSTSTSTSSATRTPTDSATPAPAASSHSSASPGLIAGAAIGGSVVLILAATLLYLCGRQRTIAEIMHLNQGALPSPMPGHFSLKPGETRSSNTPQMSNDPFGVGRYSTHGGHYDRSAAETESYRSRSPPVDESRELVIPPMNLSGSPINIGPAGESTF